MFAEVMVRLGRRLVRDYPPMGRERFAGKLWDGTRHERSTLGGSEIVDHERRLIELIVKYGQDASRTIEFGCGSGTHLLAVTQHSPAREIVGVDVSAAALEAAWRRVDDPRLRLFHADLWADKPNLGTADLVICVNAIHHLGRVRDVIERLKIFVAPGGVLIGNVQTMDHYHEYQRNVHGPLRHLGRSALFLANGIALRATHGKVHWGSYRSEILYADQVDEILRDTAPEILYRYTTRYLSAFAIRC